MIDLIEFLEARIAEDARAAELAGAHPYVAEDFSCDDYGYLWAKPGRVLAECEAKRNIIHITGSAAVRQPQGDGWEEARARRTLWHMATVYSGHPDFNPSWGTVVA